MLGNFNFTKKKTRNLFIFLSFYSQYADLTARYRLLLEQEQSHSANERKIEELELVIGNLSNEKSKLTEELQSAKEKLHSSEVMVTRLHSAASATASITGDESPVVAMIHDHQLESLTKQLATLVSLFTSVCLHLHSSGPENLKKSRQKNS